MNTADSLNVEITLPLDQFTLQASFRTHAHVSGIFGPSGSGKTSLLEVVAGLRRHAKGRVHLGKNIWLDSDRKIFKYPEERSIGYVPQDGLLFPHMTVAQNLKSGIRRAVNNGANNNDIWINVIDLLELAPILNQNVRTISGGERQRVALGRALCSAPKLMLLDEPLASLDQPLRRKILPFLRRACDEFDIPMVLVSHDPIEVQALCDDLIVLSKGKIIARGKPREVLIDPAVFPTADDRGFENVIPCTTIQSDEWITVIRLGNPETKFTLKLLTSASPARYVRFVGIPARDVIVSLREPDGLSARNILPAVIEQIHQLGKSVLIKSRIDPAIPAMAVEVGRSAYEELSLEQGMQIYLIIKSMSCTPYYDNRSVPVPVHPEDGIVPIYKKYDERVIEDDKISGLY